MEKDLMEKYRRMWDIWEVRGCILFSLFLQIFLIFSASLRKRKTKMAKYLRPIIWLAYLTADAVAMFALGLLSAGPDTFRHKIIDSSNPATINSYESLLAFWAPFLLLHLGGPDAITAFALEDNELWLRHMLWLFVEVTVAGYVFVRSLPSKTLLFPTLFMFVAGTIRYAERTWALYLASNDGFKGSIPKAIDPGTNYSKLIDEYKVNKEAGLPTKISIPEEYPSVASKTDSENVSREEKMVAFEFFTTFKCLIYDLLLNFNDRKQSYGFLSSRGAEEAFKIMDIELGFAYDILYTKAAVVHKRPGYITRAVCFTSVLVSFLLFWKNPKHGILKSDVKITYALLGGAMVLDVAALINLIFSGWMLIFLENHSCLGLLRGVISKIIPHRSRLQSKYATQYNFINSSFFKYKHPKLSESWLINKILLNFVYISDTIVKDELKEFIFEELKEKAKDAIDLNKSKDLSSCRGSLALEKYEKLKWTVDEVGIVESILLWHIATDLCYQKDYAKNEEAATKNEEAAAVAVDIKKTMQVSKVISEYMVYLLAVHPSMISSIEGVRQIKIIEGARKIKFRDAWEETMSIIKAKIPEDPNSARTELVNLSEVVTERTKMVLLDACYLVQILSSNLALEEKWKTISKVWAELLAYAASQCRGSYHAKCLSRGGELLTHVWFLMAHLGLGQQYHDAPNAKVIVEM